MDNLPMRVAMALLVDDDTCNRAWQTTMRWRQYGFGLRVLRLLPHISLKQPFVVPSFARFEAFFDSCAGRIEAQTIVLDGFRFYDAGDEGVVVLHVAEDARLKVLHQELNQALEREFGGTQAPYDGDDYEFHLTVAIGPYRNELKDMLLADIAATPFRARTVASRLAMLVYEESAQANVLYGTREYGMCKVLPLRP